MPMNALKDKDGNVLLSKQQTNHIYNKLRREKELNELLGEPSPFVPSVIVKSKLGHNIEVTL